MKKTHYVIGVDFGTDSVRSVIISTADGAELVSSVFEYPRWKQKAYCNPSKNQFRQHPLDYIEGIEYTIRSTVEQVPVDVVNNIRSISICTTASTPVAVDAKGVPLALLPGFENNPNAMFVLWKDHTAIKEADEINYFAKNWGGVDYTKYSGSIYSSEWFWSKILHIYRTDHQVKDAAFSWVEHCDYMPALLVGDTDPLKMKRSRCAAGHKALWHENWGGLPESEFLAKLDSLLIGLKESLYTDTYTSDQVVGHLSAEWSLKLGISTEVTVGVGGIDAHFGAVGGGVKENTLTKVVGTSTCDMLVVAKETIKDQLITGVCGQVDGSIIPGMVGIEAGQSAFGDVYAWFIDLLSWPVINGVDNEFAPKDVSKFKRDLIYKLSKAAELVDPEESSLIAIDWFNGRRSPDTNANVKGAIINLDLGVSAPMVYRALVESTIFGSRAIVEWMREQGLRIDGIVALGGIAHKSAFVMQLMANIMNMPIHVTNSSQACALGSAIFAAVNSHVYSDVLAAQNAMCGKITKTYEPQSREVECYHQLYKDYKNLGLFINEQHV